MYVQFDDRPLPPTRMHPWTIAECVPEGKYWNFRASPDLIPNVLEDFKPLAHHTAIQKFYELLAWLNSAESHFESNDCALGGPGVDHNPPEVIVGSFENSPISIHGRLTILYRDLKANTDAQAVGWLKSSIHNALRDKVGFYPSVVYVGEWPHMFKAIDKKGNAVVLHFWAWGDDESMAMKFLEATFDNLLKLFIVLSRNIDEYYQSNPA